MSRGTVRTVPKWLVERTVPGAGDFTPSELRAISQRSCELLEELPQVQWLEAFVTPDKLYCILIAPDEAAIREHGVRAGFPVDVVVPISRVIDPTTAEGAAVTA